MGVRQSVPPENVTAPSSARQILLTHLPLPPSRNALKSATRLRTASGSPWRRPMTTASCMRGATTSLTVRLVLLGRRNVHMDTKVPHQPNQKVTTISRPVQTQTVTVSQKNIGEECGPS